jgi:hypothetical protein
MRYYTEINAVYMANDKQIDTITHDACGVMGVDYDDSDDIKEVFFTNKEDALEASGDVVVQGYGKWSGRKVWQLPTAIQRQIKLHMKACKADGVIFKKPNLSKCALANWKKSEYRAKIAAARKNKQVSF